MTLTKLKTPVNIEVRDVETLALLWHFFNNPGTWASGCAYIEADNDREYLHELAEDVRMSSENWGRVNDACESLGIDVENAKSLADLEPRPFVKLNDEYTAEIKNNAVEVGCQTIPFEKVEALYALIQEHKQNKNK